MLWPLDLCPLPLCPSDAFHGGGSRGRFHPDKTQIRPSASGVTFLGWRLTPGSMQLSQRSIRRFAGRLRELRWRRRRGEIGTVRLGAAVRAWLAHASHGNSRGITRRLLRKRL